MGFFKSLFKFLFMAAIVGGLSYGAFLMLGGQPSMSVDAGIAEIRDHINARGELVDVTNDLNVKSIDDIKLFVMEKKVKIEFGNIALEWKLEDFTKPETVAKLKTIGINVFRDKDTGKLRVFYGDQELERWVY